MTATSGDDRFTTYHSVLPGGELHVSKAPGARAIIIDEGDSTAGVLLDRGDLERLAAQLATEGSAVAEPKPDRSGEPLGVPCGRGENVRQLEQLSYGRGVTQHTVRTRRHVEHGYYAHRVRVGDQQVTVYVDRDGAISIDVGLNTAVRIRHGRQPYRRYAADSAVRLGDVLPEPSWVPLDLGGPLEGGEVADA